jgi:hypothetical protein
VSFELLSTLVQVFCTLAIFTFLYKDNPVYKLVEHLFVGVATGYFVVVEYREVFLPSLWEPLVKGWTGEEGIDRTPFAGIGFLPHWALLHIPFVLGLLLFMRLSPRATYLARWSMAVIVGTFAGLAIIGFSSGDLFNQIRSNIIPLVSPEGIQAVGEGLGLRALLEILRNPVLIVGLITVLIYFFFSVPHTGAVGGLAKVGIWFLMVSFGASYGNTVMARISLFIGRANFLFAEETQGIRHAWMTLAIAALLIAGLAAWERSRRGREAA